MKSFTLISGILITLLGVFFFANPTNLLAIVGWLFALVMLVSGVSSLMVYFKRDNEKRSFIQLLQSIISIIRYYFAFNISMGTLRCCRNYHRLVVAGLSLYSGFSRLSPTSVWLFRSTCPVNCLDLPRLWTTAL